MPRFNPDKVSQLISEMRKSVDHLKTLSLLDQKLFLNDPDKIGSSKYHFIVSIESAIDIASHIISQNGYRAPENYADTFQVLAEKGVFDSKFSEDLTEMSRLRNRPVHLYSEMDDSQVYEIIKNRLGDFKTYLDNIATFLKFEKL